MSCSILNYPVPPSYDYGKSSEANYASSSAGFVGKYAQQRSMLDYAYHSMYSECRQLLHDQLIERFLATKVVDHLRDVVCEVPLENWIVFTAGPMGAGKGHVLQWLSAQSLFPLAAFVTVNPDHLRELLPEVDAYNAIDAGTMGYLTQKEVGYISEVLTYDALMKKKNVLVDGSLRDVHWYLEYFRKLRCDFPSLRIAIIHVEASLDIVLSRAHARALQTLRSVPDELIIASVSSIPVSVLRLSSQTDFHVRFNNNQQTVLEYACMHAKQEGCSPETEPNRKILWTLAKEEEGYLLEDDSGKWVQEDWRERFASVWVMQCALDEDRLSADFSHK